MSKERFTEHGDDQPAEAPPVTPPQKEDKEEPRHVQPVSPHLLLEEIEKIISSGSNVNISGETGSRFFIEAQGVTITALQNQLIAVEAKFALYRNTIETQFWLIPKE